VEALRQAAGLSPEEFEPIFEPARLGELQRSALDASRAHAELGFEAQTDLREGIAKTFSWARTFG
jgi:UDP-glucose 4-epimerase